MTDKADKTDKVHPVVEAIAAALKHAQENPIMLPCPKCNGKGYHHGFGEHGHDPDWCLVCGGDQVIADPYQEAKAAAKVLLSMEPSDGMLKAGTDAYWRWQDSDEPYVSTAVTDVLRAMTAAARSEMGV